MPSTVATIAEAVKDFLNATTYSQAFIAVRRYAPLETYDNLQGLDVSVAAANRSKSWGAPWASRAGPGKSCQVGIFLVKRLGQATDPSAAGGNAEIDDLVALCEEIDDSFARGPFGATGASVSPFEDSTVEVDAEAMNGKVFYCRILVPFTFTN